MKLNKRPSQVYNFHCEDIPLSIEHLYLKKFFETTETYWNSPKITVSHTSDYQHQAELEF
jgi:hypothetical protein